MTSLHVTIAALLATTACAVDDRADVVELTVDDGKADGSAWSTAMLTPGHDAMFHFGCTEWIHCRARIGVSPDYRAMNLVAPAPFYIATITVDRVSDGATAVFELSAHQKSKSDAVRTYMRQISSTTDEMSVFDGLIQGDEAIDASSWDGRDDFYVTVHRQTWGALTQVPLVLSARWE